MNTFERLTICAIFLCFGTFANAATYGGITFPGGATSFADEIVGYSPGSAFLGADPCQNASNVLGVPDLSATPSNPCGGFASLGYLGELVVRFTDNALTTSGDASHDLFVFEIGGAIEPVDIAISSYGGNWITLATALGQPMGIDIDAVAGVIQGALYSFVRIIDAGAHDSHNTIYPGADIDAIGAISSAAPPVPAAPSGVLLATGLILVGAVRGPRRRF